jgi:hypothetical protein
MYRRLQCAYAAGKAMDTRAAAARWRETWESGWRRLDAGPIVALYREDAVFQSHPFRPTEPAADYITRTIAEESAATCEFDEPIVDGDRAAVSWRGSTQLKDGGAEELRGVSLLRFDMDGLVIEQRDVWTMG